MSASARALSELRCRGEDDDDGHACILDGEVAERSACTGDNDRLARGQLGRLERLEDRLLERRSSRQAISEQADTAR